MEFKHIVGFCDNKSAVAWKYIGRISTSNPSARLLLFLEPRQREGKASSLTLMSIAGKEKAMLDMPSWAFKDGKFAEAQKI